ncbi:MAG: hypothetical protein AB2A00_31655 [Myxococcota bacterium]
MAQTPNKKTLVEGIGLGVAAGILFAIAEVIVASVMGDPPLKPFRMFSSILLGRDGLEDAPIGMAFGVGTLVHLVLSGFYGAIYGVIDGYLNERSKVSPSTQGGFGLVFGLALYLINFQVFARLLFPWFLDAPQIAQALLHALFYGAPLGLMFAFWERRHAVGGMPRPV